MAVLFPCASSVLRASQPIATLESAVVIAVPAFLPITILRIPPDAIESPASKPMRTLSVPAEAVIISAPVAKVTSAAKFTAPSTSTTSRLVVPSTSISPEMSSDAPVKAPTLKLAKASTTAAPLPAPSR